MQAVALMLLSIVAVTVAYHTYGAFVARRLQIDDRNRTPAHTRADGIDYVASSRPVVLGHHFASIAGAGPIVGPIIAISFGWLPAFLWILIGAIFIGAVHDFTTLVASLRHSGRTIGDIVEDYLGPLGKTLFLVFAFAALILVVGVFTDIVAKTFHAKPAVATTSALFVGLALMFGVAVQRLGVAMAPATVVGVVALLGCVAVGTRFPIEASVEVWVWVTLAYVAIAAVTPVWALLQPRDYLNSYLLYAMLGAGVLGLLVARPQLEMGAFTGFHHDRLGFIFPILFVTVACGAISGFHSLVASGTTSKQLDRETDARFVGFGGMLIEAVLAVLALVAAGLLTAGGHAERLAAAGPLSIFASGVGGFMAAVGIPLDAAVNFVALAVSAFALTSLDTCTRLARLILGELFSRRARGLAARGELSPGVWQNRFFTTAVVVLLGGSLTLSGRFTDVWPIFGAANQLLAALSLLAVGVWLSHIGVRNRFVLVPAGFMFVVTAAALIQLVTTNLRGGNVVLAVLALVLIALSVVLLWQAVVALMRAPAPEQ